MAYLFNNTSQYMIGGSAPVTAVPLTIVAWFKLTASGGGGSICAVGDATAHCRLSVATGQVQALCTGSVTANATTSGSASGGVWAHGAAVFSGTASRTAYLNGTASTPNTVSVTQNTFNEILIGARRLTTLGQYFGGDIAEVGIWNAVLTADEIASLAKGFPCRMIKPQNLAFYAPLVRNIIDYMEGLSLTNTNTATPSEHARIIYA